MSDLTAEERDALKTSMTVCDKGRESWRQEALKNEAEIATLKEERDELQYDIQRYVDASTEYVNDIERLREALEEIQGHCAYDSPVHEAARAALSTGEKE